MAQERLQVDALLFPCGVQLEARPGDRIMVVAGVVVGVYTGRQVPAIETPRPAAPAAAKPAGGKGKHKKPQLQRGGAEIAEARAAMRRDFLAAMRARPDGLRSDELRSAMPSYATDPAPGGVFRRVMVELVAAGFVRTTGGGGKGRYYILARDPDAQDAAA